MDQDLELGVAVEAAARLRGRFVLRSGAVSPDYFDKYRFEADPGLLRRVAARMASLLPDGTDVRSCGMTCEPARRTPAR